MRLTQASFLHAHLHVSPNPDTARGGQDKGIEQEYKQNHWQKGRAQGLYKTHKPASREGTPHLSPCLIVETFTFPAWCLFFLDVTSQKFPSQLPALTLEDVLRLCYQKEEKRKNLLNNGPLPDFENTMNQLQITESQYLSHFMEGLQVLGGFSRALKGEGCVSIKQIREPSQFPLRVARGTVCQQHHSFSRSSG